MNKSVIASVVLIIAATVLLAVGAMSMLNDDSSAPDATAPASSATSPAASIPARPDCPADGAGGVQLDCLGGETGPAQTAPEHITVVNVWAWWCGPCRDELPYIDAFADAHPEYTVVGVHADTSPGNGAAMLNDLGVDLASYSDTDNTFAGTLGLPNVIPITVVFRGTEQIGLFPTPFGSVDEIEQAVASVL